MVQNLQLLAAIAVGILVGIEAGPILGWAAFFATWAIYPQSK